MRRDRLGGPKKHSVFRNQSEFICRGSGVRRDRLGWTRADDRADGQCGRCGQRSWATAGPSTAQAAPVDGRTLQGRGSFREQAPEVVRGWWTCQ